MIEEKEITNNSNKFKVIHNIPHSEEGRKNISNGCKKAHALKREKLRQYEEILKMMEKNNF